MNDIIKKMEALVAKADEEKRSLNESEVAEYDALAAQVEALKATEERKNKLDELKASADSVKPEQRAISNSTFTVGEENDKKADYKSAYLRNLIGAPLSKNEIRALEAGTAAEGGDLVPVDFIAELENRVRHQNPFASLAGINSLNLVRGTQFPLQVNLATAVVRGEEADVSGSVAQASFAKETLTPFEVYTEMLYTRELRVQSAAQIEAFILRELSRAIAEKQHQLIVAGAGTTEPLGLSKITSIGGVSVPGVEQGSSNSGTISVANLLAIYAALEDASGSAEGAVWVMHHATYRAIINILEEVQTAVGTPADTYAYSNNKRLFLPDMRAGLNGQIFGLDVVKSKYMPQLDADNAVSISLIKPEAISLAKFGQVGVERAEGDLSLMRTGMEAVVAYDTVDMKINRLDSVVHFNNEDTA